MLVLTRKKNQEIVLFLPNGQQVIITLSGIKGDTAKIGIDAPDDVFVLRSELIDR